jgi:hypothetical protein
MTEPYYMPQGRYVMAMSCPSPMPPGLFDLSAPRNAGVVAIIIICFVLAVAVIPIMELLITKMRRFLPTSREIRVLLWGERTAELVYFLMLLLLSLSFLWASALLNWHTDASGTVPSNCIEKINAAYDQASRLDWILTILGFFPCFICASLLGYIRKRMERLARAIETT